MINFCKSSFNSLLGFPDSDDRRIPTHRWRHILPPPDRSGLHLLAADSPRHAHVVESPAVGPASVGGKPADPGAWELREDAAGGRFSLCTESLGSESCDGGIGIEDGCEAAAEVGKRDALRMSRRRRAEVRFPPPLPWMLGLGGRRSRFLKADRRDGRFVLTEIRIDPPPELLRAFREDGRLRLELIGLEAEPEVEAGVIDAHEEDEEESAEFLDMDEDEGSESSVEEDSEENEEQWQFPRMRSEGQRCVDAVSGDVSAPPWWSHRYVTTA